MAINVTMTSNRAAEMMMAVENLTRHEVLVGVPSDDAGRKDSGPTNAMLAYIHENGSPARNIPARPFMSQGIRKAQPAIAGVMGAGAKAATNGDAEAGMKALHRAGLIARNAIVAEITSPSPPFEPLRPATVRARLRRTQAGRRQLRAIQASALASGTSTSDAIGAWAAAGNARPLIDTGQLRNSIQYVVRLRPGQKAPGFVSRALSAIGNWLKRK